MIDNHQKNKNDRLITVLLAFYVIWKTPVVSLYTNTYLAMLALVLLMIQFLKDSAFLHQAPAVFGAAIVYAFLVILNEQLRQTNWFYIAWSAFLGFLPMSLGALMIYYKKEKMIRMVVALLTILYLITCITTYIGLQEFPTASRELAKGSVDYAPYYAKNIGGFGFIYSLVILHPMFICVFWGRKKKVLSLIITIVFSICVIASKYTTAALTFMISCIAYFLPTAERRKSDILRMGFIVLIMLVAYAMAPRILESLSETEFMEASSAKLKDIARVLQGEHSDTENMKLRQNAYETSWKGFLRSPIWGCEILTGIYNYDGGHSYFLDTLAKWGLIGMCFVVYMLKKILQYFKQLAGGSTVHWFMLLSFGLMLIQSSLNPIFWPYEIGFIIPIFAYYAIMTGRKPGQQEMEQTEEKSA